MSPTSRSLALLRKQGYTAQVVEKWNMWSKTRVDLFGVIDIIAIHPDYRGCLGVQATSRGHINARKKKIEEEPRAKLWLECGNRLEIWGWGKMKKSGKWEVKIIQVVSPLVPGGVFFRQTSIGGARRKSK